MRDREGYIDDWKEHFILLNKRKPTRQEQMCFKVGFNAGEHSKKKRFFEGLDPNDTLLVMKPVLPPTNQKENVRGIE